MSDLVVIKPTTDLEDLELQMSRFKALPIRLQMASNDESIRVNGVTNSELYNVLKANILYNQNDDEDEYNFMDDDDIVHTNSIGTTLESYGRYMLSTESLLDRYLKEMDCLSIKKNGSVIESAIIENNLDKIDNLVTNGIETNVPALTPYFTPEELETLTDINPFIESYRDACPSGLIDFNYVENFNKVKELYHTYTETKDESIEEEIISLGWNPSVEPNLRNAKLAHDRICNYIKENYKVNIIDVSDMIVNEDADISWVDSIDLEPVFIVLSYTGTKFGKIINKATHSRYSHAAFALTSDLQTLYSFNGNTNGFSIESIKGYLDVYKDAVIKVMCVFVTKAQKRKLSAVIQYYIAAKGNTKYNFKNCLKIFFRIPEQNKPYNLNAVCSQFVDSLLRVVNINLTGYTYNSLVSPDALDKSKNPDAYIVFEGYIRDYKQKKTDILIAGLKIEHAERAKALPMAEAVELLFEHKDILLYKSIAIQEADGEEIMSKIRDCLSAKSIFTEAKLPFRFSDKGDMTVDLPKNNELAYRQCHKLLMEYDKADNIEGMKEELAKLWAINNNIEKKLKSKKNTKRKELLDTRARVLNDFKKYLSKVLSHQVEFNFGNYFKNSEYYDKSVTIDMNTLKWSGKILKSVIATI